MKDPAFLFYSNDFLSGTMLMSNEDVGKYIRLLCLQHQKGHLREKDMLAICGDKNEEIFSKFSLDEDGNYYNVRLETESEKRKKYTESRRANRNKGDNSNTCVYLIKDNNSNLIKIGSSNKPERRLIELKNQYNNNDLILLAYAENVEQKVETELHNQYKNKNHLNEWFKLSEEEIGEIISKYNMKNHMINHMKKHMNKHMENENENENENINKNKNIKKKKIEKTQYAEFVFMKEEEYDKLVSQYGSDFTKKCVEILDNYKGSSGKKYKDDYRAILSWVIDRAKEKTKDTRKNVNWFAEIGREEGIF